MTSTEPLDKSMERVLSEALPDALNQLAQRHESFGQVVQYLEDNYIASQRSGKDKLAIENEAKRFVTKGLTSVLKDIEVASLNIDQLLQMQSVAVDSLTDDVSLIKARLHGMKGQQLTTTLDEMKVAYTPAPLTASGQMAVRCLDTPTAVPVDNSTNNGGSITEDGISEVDASVEEYSTVISAIPSAPLARRRIPIEERLSSLEKIGKV